MPEGPGGGFERVIRGSGGGEVGEGVLAVALRRCEAATDAIGVTRVRPQGRARAWRGGERERARA